MATSRRCAQPSGRGFWLAATLLEPSSAATCNPDVLDEICQDASERVAKMIADLGLEAPVGLGSDCLKPFVFTTC